MKDSYSFDRDEEGLDQSFRLHEEAYHRIFDRAGIDVHAVQAESGMMGGSSSVDFLAPAGAGENTLVTCEHGDYAADLEIARGIPRSPELPERLEATHEVETPGVATIEALAGFLGIDPRRRQGDAGREGRHARPRARRGDDRLEPSKLAGGARIDFRPATEDEIRAAFGADPGSLGPWGSRARSSPTTRCARAVRRRREPHRVHLLGVEAGRDFEPRFADIRESKAGDACPRCGGLLRFETAIEVGHIFKLDTRFSEPLHATFLDEDGRERPILMGSYGIGPGRVMAAAVEQRHDANGISWPAAIAPYDVHVVVLPGAEEIAERAAAAREAALDAVLLDDREQRAGEKFADADLIGCPVRVTAGKKSLGDGAVDGRARADGIEERVAVADVAQWVAGR